MSKPLKMTPMLRQYLEIKEQHQDTILFYRMGDFYEMFFDDAVTASRILGITLTSRSHKDEANKVPMCGIPYHAVSNYLGKMVKAGYRVAICEQTEDPKEAKGIVKREVVRIVTPGVTTDDHILDEKSNCFVCALVLQKKATKGHRKVGLSFLDISTGSFQLSELTIPDGNFDLLLDEITRLQPSELLTIQSDRENLDDLAKTLSTLLGNLCVTPRDEDSFTYDSAYTTLIEHFKTVNLAGFGCENLQYGIRAAGGLLTYIEETQKTDLSYISTMCRLNDDDHLIIDDSSRRNLELTETIIGGHRDGSLLSVLDQTATPMGARLLRQRLLTPLQNRESIMARLGAVETLIANPDIRTTLRKLLDSVYDIERLCSRLVLGHGNARDMSALKVSFHQLPEIKNILRPCSSALILEIAHQLDDLSDLHDLIHQAINDDAPITLREGKLIREGYNAELDKLIVLLRDGKQLILNLEQKERERTGIAKLKVGYNKVFGYFFEVSRLHADKVPEDFIRKQTLVNAERFITPELKELENSIATAQDQRLELEYSLFIEIRQQITAQSQRILKAANTVARIDFLLSLADIAARYRYCRPTINLNNEISITEGRHPVIERALDQGRFVPNDVHLDQNNNVLLIITGPNMAGKSTVLRQTALIALMAHLGSFVPAEVADICLVDRIFTRVGAMDDLRRGQSTFMVEMNETANILNNATEKSLVILDEIGRGTSTYDGLAIAWAVAEALADKGDTGAKTLFATHYHELTDLAATQRNIQNYSIAVREWNDTIIFLHKLVKGATNRSYGIQVASLAGVPDQVITRATAILKNIEAGEFNQHGQPTLAKGSYQQPTQPCQLPLFHPPDNGLNTLLDIDPNTISPREALDILYKAVALIQGVAPQ